MSENKWTPGPWQLTDLGDYGDFDGLSRVILGDDMRFAAVHAGGPNHEENDANARLIAAAPDMAEALRRIEEGCSFPEDNVQRACRDVARAALAKARGEE